MYPGIFLSKWQKSSRKVLTYRHSVSKSSGALYTPEAKIVAVFTPHSFACHQKSAKIIKKSATNYQHHYIPFLGAKGLLSPLRPRWEGRAPHIPMISPQKSPRQFKKSDISIGTITHLF